MYKESATNLIDFSREEIQNWLATFDVVFTDCDGVLYHDDVAIPGSPEVVNKLKSLGKRIIFVTNNSLKTRFEIWNRAIRLGFNVEERAIIAPSYTIAEFLVRREFHQKVYVVGADAICRELESFGIESFGSGPDVLDCSMGDYIEREIDESGEKGKVGAVVIAFDEFFTYGKMLKASHYLTSNPDCLFLATNSDTVHKYPAFCIPGTGAIISSIETCVDRKALLLGKPSTRIVQQLLDSGEVNADRAIMVGDCCKIDVPFGKRCGFKTLVVGSGLYQLSHLRSMQQDMERNRNFIPDFYLPTLGDLNKFL